MSEAKTGGAAEAPGEPERYTERGELGRGGMGRVLRVGDRTLDRDVAMKVVSGATDPARLQRFLNEARITGQCRCTSSARTPKGAATSR
ncbi:MAG: hypothetical protein ACYTGX_14010 [Planctomycetota bacterium]|jgi:serine/threonine protein kinase